MEASISEKYLSLFDIMSTLLWLGILLFIAHFHYYQNKEKSHYKYYLWNVYAKFFFALAFSIYYVVIFKGGDTVAYFDGASVLNNLFVQSPGAYFQEFFSYPNPDTVFYVYDVQTGYPPGWIYREGEAFFISKIISLFSFLTFKSYLASTLIIAFMSAYASWKLFTLVLDFKLAKPFYIALAVLFIPSVNFWCTGVSKDSFVYIGLCFMVYYGFKYLHTGSLRILEIISFLFFAWLVYKIRSVILVVVIVPFLLALVTRLLKRWGLSNVAVLSIRTLFLLAGFIGILLSQAAKSEEEILASNAFLNEAYVTQDDFAKNQAYGDNKYDLGNIEFTLTGLIRATPIAVFTGALRPLIWEALKPSLILNGLESMLLIYGILLFLLRKPWSKYQFIRNHEFLYFCLIFVFLLSFVTGLTSGLYGVLVRLRAPLLPFLVILLYVTVPMMQRKGEDESEQLRPIRN
jgi:hypothetical protein